MLRFGKFILFFLLPLHALSQLKTVEEYSSYAYIHQQYNAIQFFQKSAVEHFYTALQKTDSNKAVIVHFGDSHIQSERPSGKARSILQEIYGDGGRGMMFCYAAANTYSTMLYSTSFTGLWDYAKSMKIPPHLPLGVSGMTVNTKDSAAVLQFSFKADFPESYNRLRIFCKPGVNIFDLRVTVGGVVIPLDIPDVFEEGKPYVDCPVPMHGQQIELAVQKADSLQNEFEFYGMSLENSADTGLVYHSAGVGASRYRAILYQPRIPEELPVLNPDLVILDYGTNDYLYDNEVKAELRSEIETVISIIRNACPDATIILTSAQDLWRKKKNVTSGEQFSNLMRTIAQENQCGFWDWFHISGGLQTLKNWKEDGLSQSDLVHLTVSGYAAKGTLLAQALLNTRDYLLENPDSTSFLIPLDSTQFIMPGQPAANTTNNATPNNQTTTSTQTSTATVSYTYYKIKSGDTLGGIAQKFHTTVSKLKKLNGLKSDMIYAGKKLKVPN